MDLFDPVELRRNEDGEIIPESYPSLAMLGTMAAKGDLDYPGREKSIEIADQLAPHVFGTPPRELIGNQRPNEPTDVLNYRMSVYEPETKAFYGRFFNVVSRIGSPSAYNITHPPRPTVLTREETGLEWYSEEGYGDFDSIKAFTFEVLHEWLYGDPNAVLCIYDTAPQFDENGIIRDDIIPEPRPFIYPSDCVIWKRERKDYLIKTEFKSPVTVGDRITNEGEIYLYIDTTAIYYVFQIGEKSKKAFEVRKWQDHHLPDGMGTPAITLGGDLKTKKAQKWYESYIQPAVADWNKYIGRNTDLDAWFVRTMYPPQIIAAAECEVCKTSGRKGELKDRDGEWHACTSCKGTGKQTMAWGPFATYYVDPNKTDIKPSEAMFYPSIDTGLYDPASKSLDRYERKGYAALNMEMLSETNAGDSGIKRALDLKPLEDFLMRIAKRIFFLMEWQYKAVAYQRYGGMQKAQPALGADFVRDMLPEITKPYNLNYITLEMLFEQLEKAKQGGAHPSIIQQLNLEIAARKYGSDSSITKHLRASIDQDPYDNQPADDLLAANAIGATDTLSLFIHWNLKKLTVLAIAENEDFLDLSNEEQRVILERLAEDMKPVPPQPGPVIPTPPIEA